MQRTLIAAALSVSSSQRVNNIITKKSKLNWLDVRNVSLSVLERLLLEECLLRSDTFNNNWMIVGHHATGPHKFLSTVSISPQKNRSSDNKPCIVMGIGGKPEELLELDKIRQDQIVTIKRFTGGGTVVVDPECIWTSIIGRKGKATTTVKEISRLVRMDQVEAFPRPIMEWTAQAVFEPLFEQLNLLHKQTSPTFQLLENDYVLTSADDDHQQRRKMGGNAQAIVREGWLHHTSFLWTYKSMGYLKLPKKRPNYRADREHSDFLLQLQQVYPNAQKEQFYDSLRLVCQDQFDLQVVDWDRALEYVEKRGGMDALYKTSRTRVLTDL